MEPPPPRLPISAYIMVAVSAGFVFVGATFAIGIVTGFVLNAFQTHPWTYLLAVPGVLALAAMLACLSAWEALMQARNRAAKQSGIGDRQVTCDGCGESFSAQAPHCPVCGRETVVLLIRSE